MTAWLRGFVAAASGIRRPPAFRRPRDVKAPKGVPPETSESAPVRPVALGFLRSVPT